MKVMRPTWNMQQSRGSTFLRNNSFFPYLKKQHKSRDKGYIYRQTFAAILQFYFLFFYIFMYTSFLASQFCVRIQSAAIAKSLRKANLQKQEWILPLSILLPKTRFLHRPSSPKKQNTSANNTSIPPAIYPWREPHLQRVKTLKKQIHVLLKWWKQSVTLWGYCDNINR